MMIQKYKRRLKGLQMRIAMWQSNQLFKKEHGHFRSFSQKLSDEWKSG